MHWLNPGALWAPWEDVTREFGPFADDRAQLPHVVRASRYLQAESYRYVAESVRRRFPACGGLIIWMGHDCAHCTANNSLVEVDGSTKPAFDWLRQAWAPRHISLRHDRISYRPGEVFEGEVWCHRDEQAAARPVSGEGMGDGLSLRGMVHARLRTLTGETVCEWHKEVIGTGPGSCVGRVSFHVPACSEGLFLVELAWDDGGGEQAENRYLLSLHKEHPLAPLAALPPAYVALRIEAPGRAVVHNEGSAAAIGVRLVSSRPDVFLLTDAGFFVLLSGESRVIRYEAHEVDRGGAVAQSCVEASLGLEWFNG